MTTECREPLDLIRLSLGTSVGAVPAATTTRPSADERIYVKCKGDRELRGKLHVRSGLRLA